MIRGSRGFYRFYMFFLQFLEVLQVLEVLQGVELFVASIASLDYTAFARRHHRPRPRTTLAVWFLLIVRAPGWLTGPLSVLFSILCLKKCEFHSPASSKSSSWLLLILVSIVGQSFCHILIFEKNGYYLTVCFNICKLSANSEYRIPALSAQFHVQHILIFFSPPFGTFPKIHPIW